MTDKEHLTGKSNTDNQATSGPHKLSQSWTEEKESRPE